MSLEPRAHAPATERFAGRGRAWARELLAAAHRRPWPWLKIFRAGVDGDGQTFPRLTRRGATSRVRVPLAGAEATRESSFVRKPVRAKAAVAIGGGRVFRECACHSTCRLHRHRRRVAQIRRGRRFGELHFAFLTKRPSTEGGGARGGTTSTKHKNALGDPSLPRLHNPPGERRTKKPGVR